MLILNCISFINIISNLFLKLETSLKQFKISHTKVRFYIMFFHSKIYETLVFKMNYEFIYLILLIYYPIKIFANKACTYVLIYYKIKVPKIERY